MVEHEAPAAQLEAGEHEAPAEETPKAISLCYAKVGDWVKFMPKAGEHAKCLVSGPISKTGLTPRGKEPTITVETWSLHRLTCQAP